MYMIIILLSNVFTKRHCHNDSAIRPSERDMGSKLKITQSESLQKVLLKSSHGTRHVLSSGCDHPLHQYTPQHVSSWMSSVSEWRQQEFCAKCWGRYALSQLSIPGMLYGIHVWRTWWLRQYVDVNVFEVILNKSGCMRLCIVCVLPQEWNYNRSQHLISLSLTSQIFTDDDKPCCPLTANTAPYNDDASTKTVHILDAVRRQSLSCTSINMNSAPFPDHAAATDVQFVPIVIYVDGVEGSRSFHGRGEKLRYQPCGVVVRLFVCWWGVPVSSPQLTSLSRIDSAVYCPDVAVFIWRCDTWSSRSCAWPACW